MAGRASDRPPQRYEIRVRGYLSDMMLYAFPALHAEMRDGDTLLRGPLADQSALHGVLSQIEALGLELRRLPGGPPAAAESPNGPRRRRD